MAAPRSWAVDAAVDAIVNGGILHHTSYIGSHRQQFAHDVDGECLPHRHYRDLRFLRIFDAQRGLDGMFVEAVDDGGKLRERSLVYWRHRS